MRKDAVDQAKIDSLLNEIASLKQRMSEAETQNFLAIKAILTPEQVEKLATLGQPIPPQLRGVDLTDEQREQIGTFMKESKEKSQALREELRDLNEELQELLLASGGTDAAKVQQVQAKITANEVAMEKQRVDMFLKIKALLTPEQQEQLKQGKQGRGAKQGQGSPRGKRK
jgi:Spy/CpxP family protein refolding chaperone